MDFRAFLKPTEPVVLPYFGGTRVDAVDRRFRVEGTVEPGWYRFAIDGRKATPIEPAEPAELAALPAVRGHWVDGHIVVSGREIARVALPPSEEPAALARVIGRRWYSGEVVLDSIEFEDDAELGARAALEEQRGIAEVRGIVPSLRMAFAYAVGAAVAREMGVPVTLRELRVVAIADGGAAAARRCIEELVAAREHAVQEREERRRIADAMERVQTHERSVRTTARTARGRRMHGTPQERADAALEAAGARMLSARRAGDTLEVAFSYEGVRIIATVAVDTLHVYDSGICLAGADEELTLDSLPSVIKEAIQNDTLNITRHA